MYYLVSGSSGFIGYHVSDFLLRQGYNVVGLDIENDYYDISLKEARRHLLEKYKNFVFIKADLKNYDDIESVFQKYNFQKVFHLAAQAGVRYGEINPKAYIDSNITGFGTIIDLARKYSVENMVYASSSSVYGDRKTNSPSGLSDSSDNPKSLYAVTKKSNELIAKSYSDTFNFGSVGLRLFTVYGPLGRPDMAYFDFTKKCVSGQEITVFNNGNMERDFTYIDDVVKGIVLAAEYSTFGKSCIFNLGNGSPVKIKKIISIIESFFGFNINKNYSSAPKSDVDKTWADISISISELGWGLQFP